MTQATTPVHAGTIDLIDTVYSLLDLAMQARDLAEAQISIRAALVAIEGAPNLPAPVFSETATLARAA